MRITLKNSDYLGTISGGLCMLHCFVTPFLFLSSAEHAVHGAPTEWQLLNFLFVGVSFFAINKSAKNTTSSVLRVLFYFFWFILFCLILNESLHLLHLPEAFTYVSAFSLCILHIYNLNYCQCVDDNCCAKN
tara:strand:+ start:507 stop:902 length:396 start_codon:yes stop_codon:yes gene_type:complete